MIDRRELIQVGLATLAMTGVSGIDFRSAVAKQKITQDDILAFKPKGQVTLINITDIHAQLKPVYFREPSVNVGVGDVMGLPPHVTGKAFLKEFGIKAASPEAYALSSADFAELGKTYGKVGGIDRVATLVKAIRAERPDHCLLLDGGDTWQGSWSALQTRGEDMVKVMNLLKPDAMTGHWEFTLGAERVKELADGLDFPFLGGNVRDTEWEEPVFEPMKTFVRNGVKIAVIGQAFPYTPIANPRWMIPQWSFGIQEDLVQSHVDKARADDADLVVLLSHNGFDVDRKLASRVKGIDVILTGHTHDAIPRPVKVADTLLIAAGSSGKFVARLDLEVSGRKVKDYEFKLMPVLADVITPDAAVAAKIDEVRAPFVKETSRVVGKTAGLLYRRGNLAGSFDNLICDALLDERDAEISLSPGFRWGSSLLPGQDITMDDVYSQTAITYPSVYRTQMTGKVVKDILEDVADNLFHKDPYFQQGGDMVRVGGLGFTLDADKDIGSRVTNMTLLRDGKAIDAAKSYVVAGWASVNKDTKGPPVWELVSKWIAAKGTVDIKPRDAITFKHS